MLTIHSVLMHTGNAMSAILLWRYTTQHQHAQWELRVTRMPLSIPNYGTVNSSKALIYVVSAKLNYFYIKNRPKMPQACPSKYGDFMLISFISSIIADPLFWINILLLDYSDKIIIWTEHCFIEFKTHQLPLVKIFTFEAITHLLDRIQLIWMM